MRNNHKKIVPYLFMAANWLQEKQMVKLFAEGLRSGFLGYNTTREYKIERQVEMPKSNALQETGIARENVFIQIRICNEEIIRGNNSNEVYH